FLIYLCLFWKTFFKGIRNTVQSVQITPTQGEISVGESKFFLCEVVGDAKDIDWYSPSGEKILPNRPDIFVSRSDESTSTLTIYHASTDNAGIYKCVAKNGDKEAQSTVQVKIFQKITFPKAPSPQEFNEGDDADIVCEAVSSPPPNIIWKHKGSKIQPAKDVRYKMMNNGHLQIRGIKKIDEGTYTCEARVMARGEIDFRIIKVIVNVLPTIRARKLEVNATADIGSFATLACDADGFPEPKVTWPGDKYTLNDDGSELVIEGVTKLDEGEYTCIAKNKAGEKSTEVSLNVFGEKLQISCFKRTAFLLFPPQASFFLVPIDIWRTQLFPVVSHLDRNIVVRSHARVSSLTLKDIQFTYAGQYLCTASNAIGQDNQHMYLEVRYAPKILGFVTTYTWEGNPANISCQVDSHPGASVVWFRDGFQVPTANTTNIKVYNTQTTSYLEVTPLSASEFGSYNCSATNSMGTESKEFLLLQAVHFPFLNPLFHTKKTCIIWHFNKYINADMTKITIAGLKPETAYEVKISAINGKGEGESSAASTFKTKPVREPSAPKIQVKVHNRGNSFKVNWIKQDDGGSPIKNYLIKYKAKDVSLWKPEIRLPHGSEHVILNSLDWDTEYEVQVMAENQQGRSEPGVLYFRTAAEPTTIPDAIGGVSGLSTGAIVGILIVVFLLLLVSIDVTCYFLNKCGLLMCIAVNFCGKTGPGAKSKDIEEGKAAFTKDESKEPIVEVRTEEENATNQEGGGPTEPNETTPLTEDENTSGNAEVKNATAEVKTVPNEAPQSNGNESKA
uniref:Neural cell adhesion molecule 1a n=1 Tax=Cynoglossus semilaevis TaxID=244447 RepID=A0A3P8WHL8_CYNSE